MSDTGNNEEIIPASSEKPLSKILVVDDVPDFVEITRLILESNNYEVDYATLFPIGQYIHIDGFISKTISSDKLLNTIKRMVS